jgi:hypothetical protein
VFVLIRLLRHTDRDRITIFGVLGSLGFSLTRGFGIGAVGAHGH